ncbi:TonB-dependent receptor [Tenacibaculum sp. Mcav3-52]|uniref:TonB-dependent receptor n=1 Tax=unclassified Tenacibaculum TaxID=2635139 RepID=UPI0012E64FD6|nr:MULTISPECIES: carboxypeptidase-like regulatory domain-containing protein [unclassified Tenacibaculum]MCG7500616.1 TonB-dependent receptor [Tenacibaculum sp. Mcav3-52]MCO7184353.1 TonB-dependent receptor [Tenacibaculum sp. XPcli2-G]GFD78590.1 TonB-dependent receptor [Tenacibaculum sp. KUL118]
MKTFKNVLLVALFFITATVLGQTKITGTVVDEMGEPLPGANVVVKGTTNGSATDFDGKFILNASSESGAVIVSFVGYTNKTVSFSGPSDLGTIALEPSNILGEVVITGLIDVAKDRETPVAVSTIKASEIQEKLGSQEFPEILNSTPSVYATKSGGGFGDARINIRGFSQENVAVLINGVPVNDMENGAVYWSNWAGLSDVTTAMQVQRGLGSSKLAISSVGGTINIVTKTTDKKEGGSILASYGNDNYLKTLATYSTGKNENGFAASFLMSRTAGDGYVDGTEFEGYNYFIGLGWELNNAHDLQFMLTGAPQAHNQRTGSFFNMATLGDYLQYGKKYNYNHGYLNGEEFNWRRNFYHKPVASLNWNWDINDSSTLSTSAYVSFGRGGGTGDIGYLNKKDASGNDVLDSRGRNVREYASSKIFRDPSNGLVMWDKISSYNQGNTVTFADGGLYTRANNGGVNDSGGNGLTRRASVNSHNWFGLLSNFNTELNENLTLDFGIDIRSYTGIHYRRVDNLLGANGFQENGDDNNVGAVYNTEYSSDLGALWNVFKSTDKEDKIAYYNDGNVRWLGAFTQLEYKNDNISAFIQGAVSNQGFQRVDYFNFLDSDPDQKTDWETIWGGNIKGGINWNVNEQHNVFANAGYYSQQPKFDAIFLNNTNNVNPNPRNEKVLGFELGYGYRTERFRTNINLYRTQWKDRFISISSRFNGENANADIQGVEQIHMGAELDFTYDITEDVRLLGMFSYGDWEYGSTVSATYLDNDNNPILDINGNPETETLYLDGVKVGDAAQTTARLGIEVKPFKNFKIDYNQRFVDRLYSRINADDFDEVDHNGSLQLPGYSLSDLGMSYKWILSEEKNQSLNFRLNVNNLFDEEYIAESATNYFGDERDATGVDFRGIDTGNKVFFGFGTTWNFSVRYNF